MEEVSSLLQAIFPGDHWLASATGVESVSGLLGTIDTSAVSLYIKCTELNARWSEKCTELNARWAERRADEATEADLRAEAEEEAQQEEIRRAHNGAPPAPKLSFGTLATLMSRINAWRRRGFAGELRRGSWLSGLTARHSPRSPTDSSRARRPASSNRRRRPTRSRHPLSASPR